MLYEELMPNYIEGNLHFTFDYNYQNLGFDKDFQPTNGNLYLGHNFESIWGRKQYFYESGWYVPYLSRYTNSNDKYYFDLNNDFTLYLKINTTGHFNNIGPSYVNNFSIYCYGDVEYNGNTSPKKIIEFIFQMYEDNYDDVNDTWDSHYKNIINLTSGQFNTLSEEFEIFSRENVSSGMLFVPFMLNVIRYKASEKKFYLDIRYFYSFDGDNVDTVIQKQSTITIPDEYLDYSNINISSFVLYGNNNDIKTYIEDLKVMDYFVSDNDVTNNLLKEKGYKGNNNYRCIYFLNNGSKLLVN